MGKDGVGGQVPKLLKEKMWDCFGGRSVFMDAVSQERGNIAAVTRMYMEKTGEGYGPVRKRIDTRLSMDSDMSAYVETCRGRLRAERGGARRVYRKEADELDKVKHGRVRLSSGKQRRDFIERHLDEYCAIVISCMGNFEHISAEMTERHGSANSVNRIVHDYASFEDLLGDAYAEGERRSIVLIANRLTQTGAGKAHMQPDQRTAAKLVLQARDPGWAPQTRVAHSGKLEQSYEGMPENLDALAAVTPPVLKVVNGEDGDGDDD